MEHHNIIDWRASLAKASEGCPHDTMRRGEPPQSMSLGNEAASWPSLHSCAFYLKQWIARSPLPAQVRRPRPRSATGALRRQPSGPRKRQPSLTACRRGMSDPLLLFSLRPERTSPSSFTNRPSFGFRRMTRAASHGRRGGRDEKELAQRCRPLFDLDGHGCRGAFCGAAAGGRP